MSPERRAEMKPRMYLFKLWLVSAVAVPLAILLYTGPGIRDDIPKSLAVGSIVAGLVLGVGRGTIVQVRNKRAPITLEGKTLTRRDELRLALPGIPLVFFFQCFLYSAMTSDMDHALLPPFGGRYIIELLFVYRSNLLDAFVKLPLYAAILHLLSFLMAGLWVLLIIRSKTLLSNEGQ